MRKFFAVPILFLLFLVPACSSSSNLGPGVTQAKADLHVAEQNYARAQAAVISLAKAGVLKGDALKKVKQAEDVAYKAIVVARVAVDAGRTDAASIVSTALAKVLELVALYSVK